MNWLVAIGKEIQALGNRIEKKQAGFSCFLSSISSISLYFFELDMVDLISSV